MLPVFAGQHLSTLRSAIRMGRCRSLARRPNSGRTSFSQNSGPHRSAVDVSDVVFSRGRPEADIQIFSKSIILLLLNTAHTGIFIYSTYVLHINSFKMVIDLLISRNESIN